MKRFLKISAYTLLSLLLLLVLAVWLVSTERMQNYLVQKATHYLSDKLHTTVAVKHVKLSFFNRFHLEGVYLADQQKDTLAYVGDLSVQTSDLLQSYWRGGDMTLHDISLSDAFIHLNRLRDSERWNYDFIGEAFTSAGSSDTLTIQSSGPSAESSGTSLSLDLKDLQLNRVRFYMDDAWRGEDLHFGLQALTLGMDHVDLKRKDIAIRSLIIDGADVLVKQYEGGKPEDLTPDDTTLWGTAFNPDLYRLALNKLSLRNSAFHYMVGDEQPKPGQFDERHLGITGIQAEFEEMRVVADTIFSVVRNLQAEERCGLAIRSLQAKLKLSQVQAQLSELLLKTDHSTVSDQYEMTYRNFHDYKDFLEKVRIKANLKPSFVSSLDIAYFAPVLNRYPISVEVSGEAEGLIGQLEARRLELHTRSSSFAGSGTVTGLPDIDQTFFDIQVESLRTTGPDLNKLVPQTQTNSIDWKSLKEIVFEGQYKGKVDDFNVNGQLQTSLGHAALDLNLNLRSKVPSYKGHLHTEQFNLGTLVKQKSLGRISVDGDISGQGFDMNSLQTKVNAVVSQIEIEGEQYHNLTINGLVANRKFDGIFISQDPRLSLNFNGKLDLSGKEPSYDFNARFLHIDLQKLGLTKESVIASGLVMMNFSGNDIDHFLGTADMKNMRVERGGSIYTADHITLESAETDSFKIIRLRSSLADAELKGDFTISELPNSFQQYLCHYLPEYIKKPESYSKEAFTFDLHIKEADSLAQIFLPDFTGISNIYLSGTLNTTEQRFALDANIPHLGYKGILLNELLIVGAGDFTSFELTANGGQVTYFDDLIVPSYQLVSSMSQDTASLNFNSQSINDILGEASLNCRATAADGQLYVTVLPSNISIRNDKWQLSSNHHLIFGHRITIRDFVAESGAQKIVINSKDNPTNDLEARFMMIDLEGASSMLNRKDVRMYGRVSGQVELQNFREHPVLKAELISSDFVRFNQDTIGRVMASVQYDVEKQLLSIAKNSTITLANSVASVEGSLNMKDSLINLHTRLRDVSISPVGQFISDYVQDIRGIATGEVDVDGNLRDPKITGRVDLRAASLKVLFLGTNYSFDNAAFRFNNRKIEMDDIVINDERAGKYSGIIKGHITHRNFSDFYLNFTVKSNDLLCMNTQSFDNELFYGYVPARVSARLIGPLDDITVDVDARPLKGARFYLPIHSSGDISTYEYIEFASVGRSQEEQAGKTKKPYYLNLTMNIDATPDAEVFIILDPNTGEEIRAKGNGAIKLNVDLRNSISMFGNYVITEGKYLFNFRGLIPREFTIAENSKISWSGDALDASLDVKAIYQLPKKQALMPLISAQYASLDAADQQEARRAYQTFVNLQLLGSLSAPDIKFDITQPDNKAIGTAGYTKLEQIKNDEKELVSQAGVLLLLGEFKASEGITNSSYSRGSISTVSDMVASALSSEVTNLFQKLTGLKNISLNVGYQNYGAEAGNSVVNRNEFKVNVSANLFKERVIVDFGNSVDVGRDATGRTTSNYLGGDFKAQFLISEDGRLRATAYRTNNTNNLELDSRNFTKSGVGLSYRKVFNNFAEFFTSRKKRKARQAQRDNTTQKDS